MKPFSFLFKIPMASLLLGMLMAASCGSSKKGNYNTIILKQEPEPQSKIVKTETPNMQESKVRVKYAAFLKVPPDSVNNIKLYSFIDAWLYTPYLWGGTTRQGIDCSAFMQRLLADVYDIHIPRTSIQQFFTDNIEPFGSRHYLREGDLVFFTTTKEKLISHVGMYLGNRMFVNASSTYGVSIANMDNDYWKRRYVASGRVIVRKKT